MVETPGKTMCRSVWRSRPSTPTTGVGGRERVAAMLAEFGWDHPGAPVRLLSFSVKAVRRFGWLLPGWNGRCSSKMILAGGAMAGCRMAYASSRPGVDQGGP